jgi:hypothetical protein
VPWRPELPPGFAAPPTSAVAWHTGTLLVRVSALDDPPGGEWNPAADRHVAAHDVMMRR